MDRETAQKWLNRLYWVRDLFVGWYFKRMSYEDFQEFASSPWKTWIFWQLGMRYIFDQQDRAQTPSETWERRGGDCEDMSWFCQEQLLYLQYEAVLFRAKWESADERGITAHIVCIFQANESWGYMGTGPTEYAAGGLTYREIADKMVGSKKLVEYGTIEFDPETRKRRYIEKFEV